MGHGTVIESNLTMALSESWADKVALHQSHLALARQGSASDFILPLEGDPSDTVRQNHGHSHGHPIQSIGSSCSRSSASLHGGFSQTLSQPSASVSYDEHQVD